MKLFKNGVHVKTCKKCYEGIDILPHISLEQKKMSENDTKIADKMLLEYKHKEFMKKLYLSDKYAHELITKHYGNVIDLIYLHGNGTGDYYFLHSSFKVVKIERKHCTYLTPTILRGSINNIKVNYENRNK